MTTITTLLSGGEGVGLGARAAGLTHLEGFELEDAIASVARLNGFNVRTANLFDIDPATLVVPDVLHASPVCTNASVANQSAELNEDGTKESKLDIAMGEKVAQFINVMRPKVFTLENVYQYRHFKAFKLICAALTRNGYMWDYDNLNSADYGVPQTRRRLILRAVRGSLLPMLPQPERWVGWYESIFDLIPTFEPVTANWITRVVKPKINGKMVLVDARNMNREITILDKGQPAMTVLSTICRRPSHIPAVWFNGNGNHISLPAIMRLQSFPDDYKNATPKIIGNSVPPLLYQKIIAPLVECIR